MWVTKASLLFVYYNLHLGYLRLILRAYDNAVYSVRYSVFGDGVDDFHALYNVTEGCVAVVEVVYVRAIRVADEELRGCRVVS